MTTATIDRPTGEIPRIAAAHKGKHRATQARPSYSAAQPARVAAHIERRRAELRDETARDADEAVTE